MEQKSIIIVDDELLIRDLLYDFFSERNWNVTVSESGEKSSELIKHRLFDIALVDLKMPGMDGISFIRSARVHFPTMPIVIMTGFPSVETAIDALRLKVDDYFIKPFNINKLYKTIETLVEKCQRETPPAQIQNAPQL